MIHVPIDPNIFGFGLAHNEINKYDKNYKYDKYFCHIYKLISNTDCQVSELTVLCILVRFVQRYYYSLNKYELIFIFINDQLITTGGLKMKASFLSDDKVIITTAITGGVHGKEANPNIPITAEEQAQAALDCYNAGASILHLHVRGDDGQNTPELSYYNKSIRLIGEKCPMIRQIGNGIGAWLDENGNIIQPSLDQRLDIINIDPKPEMYTFNAGTFEFRTSQGGIVFENPMSFNEEFISKCNERGFPFEIEVYDLSHIGNVMELVDKGLLKKQLHFSIVLGIMGGAGATPENLLSMVGALPEGSTWQVVTIGKFHLRTVTMAVSMGGNMRTGMEDTIYYKKGELAESNAQMVERMVRIAREMGREPATVAEARELLEIKD